jgi:hypothetical protein
MRVNALKSEGGSFDSLGGHNFVGFNLRVKYNYVLTN